MKGIYKVLILVLTAEWTLCTITGINYMEALNIKPLSKTFPHREDPCNPLYWYPRNIPEFCNNKVPSYSRLPPPPPAVPVPIPAPQPFPMPFPAALPFPPAMPFQMLPVPIPAAAPYMAMPGPFMPVPEPPYGPIASTGPIMVGPPYPFISPSLSPGVHGYRQYQQAGMVPGVPGIVSSDGGINIMPMSDAYSDMLEKHKQKKIRHRLEKLVAKYNRRAWGKAFRSRRDYRRSNSYN